jgi:hypothetical protein
VANQLLGPPLVAGGALQVYPQPTQAWEEVTITKKTGSTGTIRVFYNALMKLLSININGFTMGGTLADGVTAMKNGKAIPGGAAVAGNNWYNQPLFTISAAEITAKGLPTAIYQSPHVIMQGTPQAVSPAVTDNGFIPIVCYLSASAAGYTLYTRGPSWADWAAGNIWASICIFIG